MTTLPDILSQQNPTNQPNGLPIQPESKKTSTLAIVGFVFVFLFSPLGFGLCLGAWIRDRRDPTKNSGLALAGWIVALCFFAMFMLLVLIGLAAGDPNSTSTLDYQLDPSTIDTLNSLR